MSTASWAAVAAAQEVRVRPQDPGPWGGLAGRQNYNSIEQPRAAHGSRARYRAGCHCPECTDAERVYRNQYRADRRARVKVGVVLGGSSRVDVTAAWRQAAACIGAVDMMLDEVHEHAAKALCAQCPVVAECLAEALTYREPAGVRGGLSPYERAVLVTARRRDREAT